MAPKNRQKPFSHLRAFLVGSAISGSIFLAYAGEDLFQGDKIDEIHLEMYHEEALEERYDIPVSLGSEIRGDLRDWRVSQLENVLQHARQWDYFGQQLALVDDLYVRGRDSSAVGRANSTDRIIALYCSGNEWCADDRVLIHELGHIWSSDLRDGFWMLWSGISGSEYHHRDDVSEQEMGGRCREYMDAVASVSCHGAKNRLEDVAEVIQFVYDANYTLIFQIPSLAPENIPRLERKVRLLHRYEAFSDEERDRALEFLKDYRQQQEAPPAGSVVVALTEEPVLIPSTTDISYTFTVCVGDNPCVKQTFARQFP